MSGHSKWTQIKHQKSAADQKRGKLFSILSKRISIAARGDDNPETNPGLKVVIDKARAGNMPKDTIERAIKRGSGAAPGESTIEEAVYEAYGPDGAQLVIAATTDNRNRTSSDLRHILSLAGASLSGSGSVLWNFERTYDCFVPKTTQELSREASKEMSELIAALRENEDVEEVYTNAVIDIT